MENRLVLEGLDLTDIGSLRRASAWLQEALMEDLEVVPSRGLMTEIELYLGEWIVRTIRNTPDFLLLLEATVRFIDAGTEGGGVNLLRLTANELSHLALAHVLEDPSQNRAEYQAACVISYQRYPMQVNHRQHVEYLRRMVPGAFLIQDSGIYNDNILPTSITNADQDQSSGGRQVQQGNQTKRCNTCRCLKLLSEFRQRVDSQGPVNYCIQCQDRRRRNNRIGGLGNLGKKPGRRLGGDKDDPSQNTGGSNGLMQSGTMGMLLSYKAT